MKRIGFFTFRFSYAVLEFDEEKINLWKLKTLSALKVAAGDFIPFAFTSIDDKILLGDDHKHFTPNPAFSLKQAEEFQIIIDQESNVKNTSISFITKNERFKIWTQSTEMANENLSQYFSEKIKRK